MDIYYKFAEFESTSFSTNTGTHAKSQVMSLGSFVLRLSPNFG